VHSSKTDIGYWYIRTTLNVKKRLFFSLASSLNDTSFATKFIQHMEHRYLLGGINKRHTCFKAKIIALMMEAIRTSETSVDNYFTRQYIPEDKSELHTRRRENLKSHIFRNSYRILVRKYFGERVFVKLTVDE
jgi:hypothetical protein